MPATRLSRYLVEMPIVSHLIRFGKFVPIVLALGPIVSTGVDQMIPANPGMTWKYIMTEEAGEGFRFSGSQPGPGTKIHTAVIYRIDGTREVEDKKLLEFGMHRNGRVTNTDLLTVDQQGILCWARVDEKGDLIKLSSPQTMVANPLRTGLTWNFEGEVAQTKVEQAYRVVGEEDIAVPAGKFHVFHIHGEQKAPGPMVIDRWFASGIGIVKDVTETRSDTGEMLRRISLELAEEPRIAPRPEVKPIDPAQNLTGTVGPGPIGEAATKFSSTTPKIYARWHGHGVTVGATVRCVWIAERVDGVAPPDHIIDQSVTKATAPDSYGLFALMRPGKSWAPGDYRVEFYLDDRLAETVKVKIGK